jgi:hypothetical protein
MEEVRFTISSQDSVALDFVGTIGILIERKRRCCMGGIDALWRD